MFKDKVSIIIPVYNCKEDILKRCLDSVMNQTCDNYEAIIVDDGSNEECASFLDTYQNQRNFRIIHKENGGVTTARNRGLDEATGDWILFIDNDDWIREDTVEKLLSHVDGTGHDYAFFDSVKHFENGKDRRIHTLDLPDGTILNQEQERQVLLDLVAGGFETRRVHQGFLEVWCRIYRRAFIEENHLRFHEDLTIGDDMMFNIEAERRVKNDTVYFQLPLYLRYINDSSDSNSYHPEIRHNDRIFLKHLQDAAEDIKDDPDIQKAMAKRLGFCVTGVISYDMGHPKNPKSFEERLQDLKELVSEEPYHSGIQNCHLNWYNINVIIRSKLFLLKHHREDLYLKYFTGK